MWQCVNCGHQNGDESASCEACGTPCKKIPEGETTAEEIKKEPGTQGRIYGQDSQTSRPQGRIYGQDSQASRPQGRIYGQDGSRPQGRIYGQDGSRPQTAGRTPYGQGSQGQGRAPYGQNGPRPQGQGRAPYGQNGPRPQGQGRAPYGQNGPRPQGQGRVPYDQNGQQRQPGPAPVPGQRMDQPRGPVRQGTYGQRLLHDAKKALHSPLFLILTLLYTASIGLSVASAFLQNISFTQILQMITSTEAPGELMTYAEKLVGLLTKFDSGAFAIVLLSKIPDVLLCLGFWITYFTSGKRREKAAGGGFLLARIALIIKLIISCVLMLVCLLLSVTFAVSAWVSGIQETKVASIIFLAAMIVLTMVLIMYFFCCLHTVKVCKENAVQGEEEGKASAYAAVLTMLGALISVVMLIAALVNVELIGIASAVCSMAWMILMGIWILNYRKKMSR